MDYPVYTVVICRKYRIKALGNFLVKVLWWKFCNVKVVTQPLSWQRIILVPLTTQAGYSQYKLQQRGEISESYGSFAHNSLQSIKILPNFRSKLSRSIFWMVIKLRVQYVVLMNTCWPSRKDYLPRPWYKYIYIHSIYILYLPTYMHIYLLVSIWDLTLTFVLSYSKKVILPTQGKNLF